MQAILTFLASLALACGAAFAADKPHIIFVMADDMGWGQTGYRGQPKAESHDPPLLFHLGRDASEKRDVAAQHADVLTRIAEAVNAHKASVIPGPPQLQ